MGTGSRYPRQAVNPRRAPRNARRRKASHIGAITVAAALGASATTQVEAVDRIWTAGGQGNFSDSTKYSNGAPALTGDSVFSDGTGSIINYQASDSYTLTTLRLNNDSGATVFNQLGGTLSLTNLTFGGGGASRNPTYNLTGGTLDIATAFTWGNGSNARFNYSNSTVNYNGTGLSIGIANGANGAIVGTSGTFNANSVTGLRLGTTTNGVGSITLSGTADFNGNAMTTIYLGNNNGRGNLTLSDSASFDAANAVISVGQFGTGSGTLTMSGTSTLTASRIAIGGDNAASAVTGVVNLNGGTITTGQIKKGSSTVAASSTANVINANGGKVVVTANAGNGNFFDAAFVNLASGGLTLDTNGNATGISNAMSGVGGLTKLGSGTLTLSGPNTYTGSTKVAAGAVALGASDVLADASTLLLEGGTLVTGGASELVGLLDLASSTASILQFGDADATAHALTFSGIGAGAGTLTVTNWTNAVDQLLFTSLADAESIAARTSFQDPNGSSGVVGAMVVTNGSNFEVVAVPEPASLALLALGGLCVFGRRSRD